jgi:threonine dehydratase
MKVESGARTLLERDVPTGIRAPSLKDIYEARRRIAGVARRTPLDRSLWLTELTGYDVYLKLECWQRTRSFKMRGAYNAV